MIYKIKADFGPQNFRTANLPILVSTQLEGASSAHNCFGKKKQGSVIL